MLLTDISKLIVSTTLEEARLTVSAELTKIVYSSNRKERPKRELQKLENNQQAAEDEILKTFFYFYQSIKDGTPSPLERFSRTRHLLYILTISLAVLGTLLFASPLK